MSLHAKKKTITETKFKNHKVETIIKKCMRKLNLDLNLIFSQASLIKFN